MKVFKQFEKVQGLKGVFKLPLPMAAKQMDETFSILHDDNSTATGQPGDYLMEGLKGELYVCRKDVFEAYYKYLPEASTIHGVVKFRKKPVEVDGIKWTGENTFEVVTFIDGKKPNTSTVHGSDKFDQYCDIVLEKGLTIKTLEDGPDGRAAHVASVGDYIVKGVAGEFHAVKPSIFAETYELVETPPTDIPVRVMDADNYFMGSGIRKKDKNGWTIINHAGVMNAFWFVKHKCNAVKIDGKFYPAKVVANYTDPCVSVDLENPFDGSNAKLF